MGGKNGIVLPTLMGMNRYPTEYGGFLSHGGSPSHHPFHGMEAVCFG